MVANSTPFLASVLIVGSLQGQSFSSDEDSQSPQARRGVDYKSEIRPLLSDRCYACHGPDAAAREADLRLDLREDAVLDRGGYAAIVPGDAAASELVLRMEAELADDRMPPPESKLELSADEIALIKRWIDEGAVYESHWAFVAPQRSETPDVEGKDWMRDELDAFVLARLEAAGLRPSAPADRATLLRRLSFDLIGVGPTPEEVDAFEADVEGGAYRRVVEGLLDRSSFGERMAVDWLDIARYADTYGYQNDADRTVWPYRDWVIRAFNENLPFDDFMSWQVAGDLLPEATRDQRLATTFNRLHRMTNEGGSVEEEYRLEYVADRTNTFGAAFLGLTLECARCHDHKFDPISQVDYYSMSAFFANIDESGLYSHFTRAIPTPALDLPSADQATRLERATKEIAAAENRAREGSARRPPTL